VRKRGRGGRKLKALLVTLVVLLALIVLPTGTPEDLVTTVLFIQVLGWKTYLLIALITLLLILLILPRKKIRKVFG